MDRSTFLKSLRRSQLLPRERLIEVTRQLPPDASPRALAREFVARGLLTRYQAKKVLAGKARRLNLKGEHNTYRLLEQIGRGGTGRVFKALDTFRQCVVAIKILPLDIKEREVLAAKNLEHPHIVKVYDAYVYRGSNFLVLEYLDGTNLEDLVKQHGPLPVPLACDLIRQAAEALQYAHEKGMCHRDIKPANLLITDDAAAGAADNGYTPSAHVGRGGGNWVKVLDFGLSRMPQAEGRGRPGAHAGLEGSPDYLSPEHIEGMQRVDIRSDLYGLGCTLYFALTGRVPFPGNLVMEKLTKHLLVEAEPVERLRPEVPAVVAAIVRKLMAKNPRDRFQTPARLARALAPWCDPSRTPDEGEVAEAMEPEFETAEEPSEAAPGEPLRLADSLEHLMEPWRGKTLPVDPALRVNWRRWSDLVRRAAKGYRLRNRIGPEDYRALVYEIVDGCRSQAGAAEAGQQYRLFWRLGEVVRPWATVESLERSPREVRAALVRRCEQVEKMFGIRSWRHHLKWWLRLLTPAALVAAVAVGWAVNEWVYPFWEPVKSELFSVRDRVLGVVNRQSWLLGAAGLVCLLAYFLARSTRH